MMYENCEFVRDVYPDVLNGTADALVAEAVRAHVAACAECAVEVRLLDALQAVRTSVPDALHERVLEASRRPQPRWRVSRSSMAMAATLAAALLGGSLIVRMQQRPLQDGPAAAAPRGASPAGLGFVGVEDAMMSGKASLDDLSVEQLEKLLEEVDS